MAKTVSGRDVFGLTGLGSGVPFVVFSRDGDLVAATVPLALPRVTKVWRTATGKEILTVPHSGPLAFSHDGRHLLVAAYEGSGGSRTWDLNTGMEGKSGPHAQPSAAALSPDRKRIAWGAGRREPGTPLRFRTDIEVVDAGTGKVQLVLRGHTGRGICVSIAFSGDGRRIVSGGRDGTVRLWDAETGQEMLTFRGLAPVMSVAFSLDDQRIIAGSEDGTIWEWEAPLAKAEPGKAK